MAYWKSRGCAKGYERREARRHIRRAVLRSRPVKRFIRCTFSRRSSWKLRTYLRHYRQRNVWRIRFARQPLVWKAWARRVTACESGWRQGAVSSGGHLSYFQWLPETWRAAGGWGDPRSVSWYPQAVLAIRWARRVGASQWSCK